MNTTELFDFYFVNRENERNALKNFMSDANNVSLWIVDIILECTEACKSVRHSAFR